MGASELDDLEEITEQTALRVNERTRHGKFGWAVSPNIERSSVTREKKIAESRSADAPPSPATPPTVSMRNSATLGRMFTDYRTLIETCRARADELALSRLELDRLAGLPSGYSAKLLGKVENTKDKKRIWPVGLGSMLGTLGLRMLLIEDEAATARTLALRTPVDRANQRFGNTCRISATLLPPPSQPPSPPVLTIVPAKRSAKGRQIWLIERLTQNGLSEQRSDIKRSPIDCSTGPSFSGERVTGAANRRLLLMRAVVLSELPLGKGLPFVAGNLSFHPVYLNDESVWTVKAQEGCSVTVQFLDQK